MIRSLLVIVVLLTFAGCAQTRVVLLPDSEGKVGQVEVSTEAGSQILDKENEFTVATSKSSVPDKPETMQKDEMQSVFKSALSVLPEKPVSFLLYFTSGTSDLTAQSLKMIPEVIESVKKREPCEVSIIGHSDTMGAADYNVTLSLERANSIKDILIQKGVNISKLEVRSHGEHDPIIKTADEVSEPRNRRVEVMVR